MKRIALMMVLILAGIVLLHSSKPKETGQPEYREEGEDDMVGQEFLKYL